jgi:hypothetical protein
VGPPPPADLDIHYSAPAQCPDRTAFEKSIHKRTEHASSSRDGAAPPKRLDVRLEQTATGVRGRLAVADDAGGTTVREIEAATCAEAVDGLALIVALLFDPGSAKGAVETPPPEESPKPAPRDVTNEPKRSSHIALSTSFIAASGHAPDLIPGGELALALEVPLFTRMLLFMKAGVRLTAPDTVSSNEGLATFKWWAGLASVCPALELRSPSFVGLCVSMEQGVLSATGSDTRNPRSSGRSWTAVGPGLALRWSVLPPLFMFVAADALFPLRRDRFFLGTEQIHEVPAVAFRAEVGVGVRF